MYRGTGIYSLPEASRLIGVSSRKIRRWLYGYSFPKRLGHPEERSFSGPLWQPQLSKEEFEAEVIGFNDLLEVRFVAAFVAHGVPLIVVRRCLDNARETLGVDYPMTSGSFKTDGKTIFADAVAETVLEGALLDLKSLQYAFKEVIRPSLYAGIEYEGQRATRWYPQEGRRHIVLDPSRDFGSPIVEKTGTPTSALYASFLAEGENRGAIVQTARIYQAPPRLVEAAVGFERALRRTVH
jgi:hypothetical protein